MKSSLIIPDWPAPGNIQALSTTRKGGYSLPPYEGLNLGLHVKDQAETVAKNREYLIEIAKLPSSPYWLDQNHSAHVIPSTKWQKNIQADAIFSSTPHHICTIMTADCLPILLCNHQGTMVAAIHAGWRGLAAGIIEQTVIQFSCLPSDIMAWFGPAIGSKQFEVGSEVYDAFCQRSPSAKHAFEQTDSTHYLADIYLLASQHLNKLGIHNIFGGHFCTVTEQQRFFSYRREGITGRMASMIWIEPK